MAAATRAARAAAAKGGCGFAIRPAVTLVLVLALAATTARAAPGPCRIAHASDQRIPWTCRTIPAGGDLETMFGARWRDVARFNRIDRRHARPGTRIKVPGDPAQLAVFEPMPAFYAPADSDARYILVDLGEQFLGAYEFGRLVFSAPLTSGAENNATPAGDFRIDAADARHRSSLYHIGKTDVPYPMHWALRFLTAPGGVDYWIHGRDLPGAPGSHGCIGLYDEDMQAEFYADPRQPQLDDARRLFEWAVGPLPPGTTARAGLAGPRVRIVGSAPQPGTLPAARPVAELPGAPVRGGHP